MYKKILLIVLTSSLLLVGCNKKNKKYTAFISTADSLFNNNEYEKAKTYFLEASKVKPEEKYPTDKIVKIDSILVALRVETQYQAAVKIADELFDKASYDDAMIAYQSVMQIKPGDPYANKRIKDIEYLVSQAEQITSDQYHVIVGSFSVKANATRLQNKLISEGCDSYIIPRLNGSFHAVTCASYPDVHHAYNSLNKARDRYHKDSWVLKHEF